MLVSLCLLAYALFLSGHLTEQQRFQLPADGLVLIQLLLGGLFLLGCGLTLREARQALITRPAPILDQLSRQGVPLHTAPRDEVEDLVSALEWVSRHWGGQLEEQGRRLQRIEEQEQFASHSLEFMYRASHYLTENALGSTTLELLIDDLTQTLGAKSCTLTLITAAAEALGPSARPSERLLLLPGDEQALPAGPARLVTSADGSLSRFTVCVQDALDSYGQLSVEIRGGLRFEGRQTRLVEATASLLALSLGNLLRDQRRRRLAVMDERNAIAGELHDSLAQALAYMKIQVARLQKELDHSCHQCGTKENKKINEVSSEIKTGLDSAYRHLRELLTAFRTDMPPGGLRRALQEVVTELDARAATNITLDYPTDPPELANHEEFHVLQIVREALTNVVRHARAQQARVSLESLPDGQLQARIEDDGRGALDDLSKEGHYGVSIMKDRARQLGGTLTVEAVQADGKGTRITLNFTPRSRLP